MEKGPNTRPNRLQTFMDGATNGAINGAMMLGIFTGLMALASITPLAIPFSMGSAISTLVIGTVATSLFGGVASIRKENKEYSHNKRIQYAEHGPTRDLIRKDYNATIAPVPVPVLADKAERSSFPDKVSSWRERVSAGRQADKASFAESLEAERAEAESQNASIA